MRRILFVNQFYYPDPCAVSIVLQQLATSMASRGYDVTVLTGKAANSGGSLTDSRLEVHEGVRIIRVGSTHHGKQTNRGRLSDYLSFHLAALWRLLRLPAADLVVTLTAPPLVGFLGLVARIAKGSRFVYWVHDVYPDLAETLGVVRRESVVYQLSARLSRFILTSADCVVALAPDMAARLQSTGGPRRLQVIRNWAMDLPVSPAAGPNHFLAEQGLEGRFVLLYAGNLGLAHDFDTILKAAAALRDDPTVQFVFVGSGARKLDVIRAIDRGELSNVRVLPPVPSTQLADMLRAPSVGVITQAPGTTGLVVPSKLYGLLAAAQPVLFVGPGDAEVTAVICQAGCGFSVQPGDVDGLTAAVQELRRSPERRADMGARGRAWFLQHASHSRAMREFDQLFADVIGPGFAEHADAPTTAQATSGKCQVRDRRIA